jgi:hypothetical protein
LSGDHCLHEYPQLNGECFQEFLDWLSQELGEDWAILQVDQTPTHMSSAIRWLENIIPVVQPADPELNPILGVAFPKGTILAIAQTIAEKSDFSFLSSAGGTRSRTI